MSLVRRTTPILVLFKTFLVILVIRTWAVWKQDRRVGAVLGLMWIVIVALALLTDISFLKSLQGMLRFVGCILVSEPAAAVLPVPYPGYRGCTVSSGFSVRRSGDRTALGMIVLDTSMLHAIHPIQ